jgi:hypothetical protein
VIPDPLIEPLRRLEIAAEWFRVAYRMNKDPRQNPHLYRQLAEMKRQIEAMETELQGDGRNGRQNLVGEGDWVTTFGLKLSPTPGSGLRS